MESNLQIADDDVSVSLSNTPTVQINGDNVTPTFFNMVHSSNGTQSVTTTNSEGSDTENF